MATYVPVTVVPSGGVPFVQVSGNAPAMTVVPNAAPITLVTANAPGVVLYNPDGSPYSTDPFPQTSAILGAGGLDYAFYDSGLAASMFQDSAGTTPATLTNPVGLWNVRQKPPHFASQSVGGQRPVLQSDGLKFDGSDDNLLTDWLAQAGANCIIAQVTVPVTLSGTQVVVGMNGSSDAGVMRMAVTTAGLLRVSMPGQTALDGGPDIRGASAVIALSTDGTLLRSFVNDSQAASGNIGGQPNTAVPFRLGARNNNGVGDVFFGGSLKRIALGKTALSLEQFQSIAAEFRAAS